MTSNDGKKAENYCREAFKALQEGHGATYLRLYDTTSAGGKALIPEQPGDFVLIRDGRPFLIEVKSSDNKSSMADISLKGYVKPSQKLGARMWVRSGATSMFIFISLIDRTFEIWSGGQVIRAMKEKRRLYNRPDSKGPINKLLPALIRMTKG